MSNKQKAHRTKGNVRPSSSGRAAELLSAGGATVGFVGFQALSGDLGYVPTGGAAEDVGSTVDSDFRMVMRKTAKRDVTTKIKALQEFAELCREKSEEDVKGALPFWPRIYNKLAMLISDNLLQQTAATMSDVKTTPKEEVEAKYVRVVSASILGLRMLLLDLPAAEREKIGDSLTPLLADTKFWAFGKHKNAAVRAAIYALLSMLCEVLPSVARAHAAKLCPLVLGSLDESEPGVSAPCWDAVLHVVDVVQDCWSQVNVRKAVLPKLWTVLRSGAGGNAADVFPSLLPFLSRLPPEVLGEGLWFYEKWFDSMVEW
ncbi:PREDICTED: E3 ubiquitin-protein ligase listerin-like [Priapulus caudatus]|uniref:E3 ubiquitin-protein ligase listerin n=1 Tax=Priapulus caudatus TaxID=37621 RepID=A0ABM1EZE3_PRICU|nr:PREDICTED: E3 ubiquitin-protein ligase listerin-like [Priapulus caudatus]